MGVPVVLDVPTRRVTEEWIGDVERVGVDGFLVTTNIDQGSPVLVRDIAFQNAPGV